MEDRPGPGRQNRAGQRDIGPETDRENDSLERIALHMRASRIPNVAMSIDEPVDIGSQTTTQKSMASPKWQDISHKNPRSIQQRAVAINMTPPEERIRHPHWRKRNGLKGLKAQKRGRNTWRTCLIVAAASFTECPEMFIRPKMPEEAVDSTPD